MKVVKFTSEQWSKYAETAHLICFDENRPADMNRIDFALVVEEDSVPLCYTTCREVDSETVYMQYGGAFPSAKGTIKSYAGYGLIIEHLLHNYANITTLIENKNTVMLKFAMKVGFLITGLRNYKNTVLLEHSIYQGV